MEDNEKISSGVLCERGSLGGLWWRWGRMFMVVRVRDAIPIPASELDKPRSQAVANQIEEKYSNRVLIDVGLCICLFEICELGDSLMYQSDSAVHV